MTTANRLATLREQVAETEQAIADIVSDNAVSVTIEGRSVTRPSMAMLNRRREQLLYQINQLESGGSWAFTRSIRFTDDES